MKTQMKYLQDLFFDILNDFGRVYVVIKHSENTIIGARGFSDEEKKQGMVLVFNHRNCRNLVWSENGSMQVTLGFGAGNKTEKCFIYADDIVSVFSPDAKIKLDRWDIWERADLDRESDVESEFGRKTQSDKVVPLDKFRKSKD